MERKVMNSFGTITIPSHMRKELGIDGSVMLWVDIRDTKDGSKEIVLRKSDTVDSILKKYKNWAEVMARVSEHAVSIIWNGQIVSMSNSDMTESFVNKGIIVSHECSLSLKRMVENSAVVKDPEKVRFLPNGEGKVLAYFRMRDTGDDNGFFVVVGGTKHDSNKITKTEEMRRFHIINDIVSKI